MAKNSAGVKRKEETIINRLLIVQTQGRFGEYATCAKCFYGEYLVCVEYYFKDSEIVQLETYR